MFIHLKRFMKRCENPPFKPHEEGAAFILFAIIILPLIVLSSMALELSRQTYINTQLAYACDTAAIAGARYEPADYQANALKVFNANYTSTTSNVSVTPVITLSSDKKYVTVSASATMPTTMGGVANILSLKVGASTQVERNIANIEVGLVLDVTGSMANDNKIAGLRNASKLLINQIYEGSKTRENTAISIIPYVASTNIGTANASWLDPLSIKVFPSKAPWAGCVFAADTGTQPDTDAPPSATRKWPMYYAPSTTGVYGVNVKGDNDWSQNPNGSVKVVNAISGVPSIGPNRSCAPSILPLTNNSTTLLAKIDTLQPIPGGGTFGNLGLVWGWNTLSPKWIGKWSGGIDPKPYEAGNIKTIVIVTDGENNWHDQPSFNPTGDITSYGRVSEGKLGTTSLSQSRTKIDDRLSNLCTQIKAQGIQIFTVTFMVSDTQAKKIYGTCASKPEWAFQAESSTQLAENFSLIASQIKNITIRK